METNKQDAPQVPVIPESEMKLPEESVQGETQGSSPSARLVNPLLIVLLVVLLAILAAVIIWGEEIINTLMPTTTPNNTMEVKPLEENQATTTNKTDMESDVADMEAELSESELDEFDAEMQAIEAEINAELDAE